MSDSRSDTWHNKRQREVFPNEIDWSELLGGAAITACAVEVIEGVVNLTQPQPTSATGAVQTVWVSGGEPGKVRALCSIETDDGRTLEHVVSFTVIADPAPAP